MRFFADLHIHSKYSRACSSELNLENLEKWALVKGIDLLGTGDFCHPKWFEEIKNNLIEDDTGILRSKSGFPFILQNEISLVFTQGGKGRRVHLVIIAPNISVVEKITLYLKSKGRVDYDGRPIFNISCRDFTHDMMGISEMIEVIPAHAWTPWFGVFGSKSGFDSLEEAFLDQSNNIHAIESGLSSDPGMNRRLSKLDNIRIISSSDAHSFWPWRLGREATIFDLKELTYKCLIKAIRTGEGFIGTIEVDPSYGKYHFDGHRACDVSMSPDVSKKINQSCPVCQKPLTIGVLNRIEELANRPDGKQKNQEFSYKLIPLHELISVSLGTGMATKAAWAEYHNIMKAGKNEYDILLNISEEDLLRVTSKEIVELIIMNRRGELVVKPGYDGEYGRLVINGKESTLNSENDDDKHKNRDTSKKKKPASENPSAANKKQSGLGDYI